MPHGDVLPVRGAVGQPLTCEVVRELTEADIASLVGAPKVSVPVLQSLRSIHHQQARLLAEGKKQVEVAHLVGSTPARISQLMHDPTFTELVEYYKDQIQVKGVQDAERLQTKILDAAELAVDEINERLEDPELRKRVPIGELRKIGEFGLDRTVAPPKGAPASTTPPMTITLDFGGRGIQKPLDKPEQPAIIDVTPTKP